MPRIPQHTRRLSPSGRTGSVKAPYDIARTGEAAIGAGIQNLGKGVGDLGRVIAEIQIRKQNLIDSNNQLKTIALHDAYETNLRTALDQAPLEEYGNIHKAMFEEFNTNARELNTNSSPDTLTKLVAQLEAWGIKSNAETNKMHTAALLKENALNLKVSGKEAVQSDDPAALENFMNIWNNSWPELFKGNQALADEALANIFREGMIEKVQNQAAIYPEQTYDMLKAELDARKNGETTNEQLQKFLPDNKDVNDLLNTARTELNSQRIKAENDLKILQSETQKELLLSLWDGELTESSIRTALEKDLIDTSTAESFRKALTSPQQFDLGAYIETSAAINAYKRGVIPFDDALATVVRNQNFLGDNGKALTNSLFGDISKSEAEWEKEGLDYIDAQILDKDLLTGILHGSPEQLTAAMEARLDFDKELELAEKRNEPVTGRDKLILAHDVMLKHRIPSTTGKKPPAELKEGLGEVPFLNTSEIDKAIQQAKENLGEKASPEDIKVETMRLLGQ
jgi:hypothetical protein